MCSSSPQKRLHSEERKAGGFKTHCIVSAHVAEAKTSQEAIIFTTSSKCYIPFHGQLHKKAIESFRMLT